MEELAKAEAPGNARHKAMRQNLASKGVWTFILKSFQVGKVNFLDLHPISFSEFVSALDTGLHEYVKSISDLSPIPDAIAEGKKGGYMLKRRRSQAIGRGGAGNLKLSWRIGLPQWEADDMFYRLLGILKKRSFIVDEVALFETITHHLYIPLDVYAKRMQLAAKRIGEFHKAGVKSAGINVLCTIGHINEGWSYMPPLPFQPMVGHDGAVSTGCACPNTREMRDYVKEKYRLVAEARPDFIWVDDDIRMHHHGVAWGCFCPTCLKIFAKRSGLKLSRVRLVKVFDDPKNGRLRRLWIEQNIETIESLMADIAEAVQKVDKKIALGLMTAGASWTTYTGQAFGRWFTALKATKARPGGGFYSDAAPGEMLRKAFDCGQQRTILPAKVADVQYELENFPYQILKKSKTALVDECTLALGYGLNGIAFNMLGTTTTEKDFMPWIDSIPAARPVWEEWVANSAGLPTAGLWPAWSPKLMAERAVRKGESWLGWHPQYDVNRPKALFDIGLPLAADAPGCAAVLCGRIAEAFTDEELKKMLSGGVIMDTETLSVLEERGLGSLTGVKISKRLDNGMMERFTDDEMNGSAAGQLRDARIEFWGNAMGMADILEPTAKGVRILATIEDYFYRGQGLGMTAFENTLGGRVVVMGYAQWIFISSVGKRLQLQNAADWASRGKMPVRVEQAVPLVPVVRISPDRNSFAAMLVNAGMDEINEVDVEIRAKVKSARLLSIGQKERAIKISRHGDSCGKISLRNLPPWSIRIVLAE